MRRLTDVLGIALVFAAGIGLGRFSVAPAGAQTGSVRAQLLDLAALTPADLPSSAPGENPLLRTTTLVDEPGAVVRVQIGTVPKHYHDHANEMQYVVDGTGTEWFGSRQIALKPGVLLVIPKGMVHGGLVETSGRLKILTMKTPPQAPTDNHVVP